MDKIFQQAKDKNIANTVLYVKTSDAYAYLDNTYETKVDAGTMKDMFLKGVVIVNGTHTYMPTDFDLTSGVGTLTYVTANTTTATTAVLATIKSKEYAAAG